MFTENKIMKLNYNSTSAKLYRWFYGEESMPSNLCPYFWKLVVAYFFALPLALFTLPLLFMGKFSDSDVGHRLGVSVVMWTFGISMIAAILSIFVPADPEKNLLYALVSGMGFAVWFIAIGFGSIRGLHLLYEMVKAKYNKYCPKIDWNK